MTLQVNKTNNAFMILATTSLLGLSGCASIVGGQNQPLSVATPGCAKAVCELQNDKGKWYVPSTPGTVTVRRSYSDLQVNCTMDNFTPSTASVKSSTKGMAFGNILFGGVIGAGVDMASGAAYDYPNEITIPMNCSPHQTAAATATNMLATNGIKLGSAVKTVDDEMALAAGLTDPLGVLVTSVNEGGVASVSNIKVGVILAEFNSVPITDSDALRVLLEAHKSSDGATFIVFRERQYVEIELQSTPSEI